MDFVSHALWGMTIVRRPELFGAVFIASNLPDIFGSTPYWSICSLRLLKGYKKRGFKALKKAFKSLPKAPYTSLLFYHSFHNLFAWLIFSLILYMFFPTLLILSLAYLSHILVDIPTHKGDFATRIFYPFSDFHFEGASWIRERKIVIANFALILLVNLVIWKIA